MESCPSPPFEKRHLSSCDWLELPLPTKAFSSRSTVAIRRSRTLLLYENGPCSNCRCDFVEELMPTNRFSDRIREECRCDASFLDAH
jgi:hypothetical protein